MLTMPDLQATIGEAVRVALARALYRGGPIDRRVCTHEAAHAVICWIVGGSPLVEVVVRDDASGEMTNAATQRAAERAPGEDHADRLAALRVAHPEVLRLTCARHIATVLAGVTADQRAGDGRWLQAREDLAQADRLAEVAVGRSERDRFLVPIRAAVRSAVADSEDIIGTLADVLADHRRLPGSYVTSFLETRPDAVSLRLYYSAAFSTSAPIDKPSLAGNLSGESGPADGAGLADAVSDDP
jgi:hypothetical protein